jgi:hypothetical protein
MVYRRDRDMFINYFKLKAYIKNLGFDDYQAKETIKKIRKMDKELKQSFIAWFNKGILPEYEIENFAVQELVDKGKMNEIKAFLYMDWLKKDPNTAKKALSKLTDMIVVSPELKNKLEEKLSESSKKEEAEAEDTSDIGDELVTEGLTRVIGNKKDCGYANCDGKLVIQLTDKDGKLVFATKEDINWEDPLVKEYEYTIKRLSAEYYFGGYDFKNGVALVMWTVLPDGRYFADEDGFGAEDNDEVNIYCYIDKQGKVLVKFQSMTENQIKAFRKTAEEIAASRI